MQSIPEEELNNKSFDDICNMIDLNRINDMIDSLPNDELKSVVDDINKCQIGPTIIIDNKNNKK